MRKGFDMEKIGAEAAQDLAQLVNVKVQELESLIELQSFEEAQELVEEIEGLLDQIKTYLAANTESETVTEEV
jgi:hypothetical protein